MKNLGLREVKKFIKGSMEFLKEKSLVFKSYLDNSVENDCDYFVFLLDGRVISQVGIYVNEEEI